MQQALAAVGRAGAAWSFARLPSPRINLQGTVVVSKHPLHPGLGLSSQSRSSAWVLGLGESLVRVSS